MPHDFSAPPKLQLQLFLAPVISSKPLQKPSGKALRDQPEAERLPKTPANTPKTRKKTLQRKPFDAVFVGGLPLGGLKLFAWWLEPVRK